MVFDRPNTEIDNRYLENLHPSGMTPYDKKKVAKKLEKEMKKQAEDLNFELAIEIRDKVNELKETS